MLAEPQVARDVLKEWDRIPRRGTCSWCQHPVRRCASEALRNRLQSCASKLTSITVTAAQVQKHFRNTARARGGHCHNFFPPHPTSTYRDRRTISCIRHIEARSGEKEGGT